MSNKRKAASIINNILNKTTPTVSETRNVKVTSDLIPLTSNNKHKFIKIGIDTYVSEDDASRTWRVEYIDDVPYLVAADAGMVFRRDYDVKANPKDHTITFYNDTREIGSFQANSFSHLFNLESDLQSRIADYSVLPENMFCDVMKKEAKILECKHIDANKVLAADKKDNFSSFQKTILDKFVDGIDTIAASVKSGPYLQQVMDQHTKYYGAHSEDSSIAKQNLKKIEDGKSAVMVALESLKKNVLAAVSSKSIRKHMELVEKYGQLYSALKDSLSLDSIGVTEEALQPFVQVPSDIKTLTNQLLSPIRKVYDEEVSKEDQVRVVQPKEDKKKTKKDKDSVSSESVLASFKRPVKLLAYLIKYKKDIVSPIFSAYFVKAASGLTHIDTLLEYSEEEQGSVMDSVKASLQSAMEGFLNDPFNFSLGEEYDISVNKQQILSKDHVVALLQSSFRQTYAELFNNSLSSLVLSNPLSDFKIEYEDKEEEFARVLHGIETASASPLFNEVKSEIIAQKLYFTPRMNTVVQKVMASKGILSTVASAEDITNLVSNIIAAIVDLTNGVTTKKAEIQGVESYVDEETERMISDVSSSLFKKFGLPKDSKSAANYEHMVKMLFGSVGDVGSYITLLKGQMEKAGNTIAKIDAIRQKKGKVKFDKEWSEDPEVRELETQMIMDSFMTSSIMTKLINIVSMSYTNHVGGDDIEGLPNFIGLLLDEVDEDSITNKRDIQDKIYRYMPSPTSGSRDLYLLSLLFNSKELDTFFSMLEEARETDEYKDKGPSDTLRIPPEKRIFNKFVSVNMGKKREAIKGDVSRIFTTRGDTKKKFNKYLSDNAFVDENGTSFFPQVKLPKDTMEILVNLGKNNTLFQSKEGSWKAKIIDPNTKELKQTVTLDEYQDKYMPKDQKKKFRGRLSDIVSKSYEIVLTATREHNQVDVVYNALKDFVGSSDAIQEAVSTAAIFGSRSLSAKINFELVQAASTLSITGLGNVVDPVSGDTLEEQRGMAGMSLPMSDPGSSKALPIFPDKTVFNKENYIMTLNLMSEASAKSKSKVNSMEMLLQLKDSLKSFLSGVEGYAADFISKFNIRLNSIHRTVNQFITEDVYKKVLTHRKNQLEQNKADLAIRAAELEEFTERSTKPPKASPNEVKAIKNSYIPDIDRSIADINKQISNPDQKMIQLFKNYFFSTLIDDMYSDGKLDKLMKAHTGGYKAPKKVLHELKYRKRTDTHLSNLIKKFAKESASDDIIGMSLTTLQSLGFLYDSMGPLNSITKILSSTHKEASSSGTIVRVAEEDFRSKVKKVLNNCGSIPAISGHHTNLMIGRVKIIQNILSVSGLEAKISQYVDLAELRSAPNVGARATQWVQAQPNAAGLTDALNKVSVKEYTDKRREDYSTILELVSSAMTRLDALHGSGDVEALGNRYIEEAQLGVQRTTEELSAVVNKLKSGTVTPEDMEELKRKEELLQSEILKSNRRIEFTKNIISQYKENPNVEIEKLPEYGESYFSVGFSEVKVPQTVSPEGKESTMKLVSREVSVLERNYNQLMTLLKEVLGLDFNIVERFLMYYNTIDDMVVRYFTEVNKLIKQEKVLNLNPAMRKVAEEKLNTSFRARFIRMMRLPSMHVISPHFMSSLYEAMESLNWFGNSKEYYVDKIKNLTIDRKDAVDLLSAAYSMLITNNQKLVKISRKRVDFSKLYSNAGDMDVDLEQKLLSQLGLRGGEIRNEKDRVRARHIIEKHLQSLELDEKKYSKDLVNVSPVDLATFYSYVLNILNISESEGTSEEETFASLLSEAKAKLKVSEKDANTVAVDTILGSGLKSGDSYELTEKLLVSLYGVERGTGSKVDKDLESSQAKHVENISNAHVAMKNSFNQVLDSPTQAQISQMSMPWLADVSAFDKPGTELPTIVDPVTGKQTRVQVPSETLNPVSLADVESVISDARSLLPEIMAMSGRPVRLAVGNLDEGNYGEFEAAVISFLSTDVITYLVNITKSKEEKESEAGSYISKFSDKRVFSITQIVKDLLFFISYIYDQQQGKVAPQKTIADIAAKIDKKVISTAKEKSPYSVDPNDLRLIVNSLLTLAYNGFISLRNHKLMGSFVDVMFAPVTAKMAHSNGSVKLGKIIGNMVPTSDIILSKLGSSEDAIIEQNVVKITNTENVYEGIDYGTMGVINDTLEAISGPMVDTMEEYTNEVLRPDDMDKLLGGIIQSLKNINNLLGG